MNAMAKMANPQRVEENVIDITKGVPCKVEMNKIWQKSNLIKICNGFLEYSNWIPKVTPSRVETDEKRRI